MEILRNGTKFTLTRSEIEEIVKEEHRSDIRYEVEQALDIAIENEWVSFDSWKSCPCGDYSSETEARNDFIEDIVRTILEREESDYNYPYRYEPDYDELVCDTADDYGYLRC